MDVKKTHEPDKETQNPAEQIAKFAKEYRKIFWKNNPSNES